MTNEQLDTNNTLPSPSPSMALSSQEKNWAVWSHLSAFVGFFFPLGNIIAPVILWQIKKEELPFGSAQAKECLNFQISVVIYLIASWVLMFVFVGFLTAVVVAVCSITYPIRAAIKASKGIPYKYPMTIRLIK